VTGYIASKFVNDIQDFIPRRGFSAVSDAIR
jgi:hypothetical protein